LLEDPTNSDDIIDSRDIETRIDELDGEQESLIEAFEDADTDLTLASHGDGDETGELTDSLNKAAAALASFWGFDSDPVDSTPDAIRESIAAFRDKADGFLGDDQLHALKAFRDEMEPYCDDWQHGVTLIRDSYFKEYAQELAEDIGAINSDASWPNDCIDWDKAARELRMDTSGDFDGVTYWGR
jgi:hypothetical protein